MTLETKKFLEEEEIKNYLESYKGRLPTVVLEDIMESLRGKKITEEQLERIIEKASKRFRGLTATKLDDVYEKINSIERLIAKTLEAFPKERRGDVEEVPEAEKHASQPANEAVEDVLEVGYEDVKAPAKRSSIMLTKIPETPRETVILLKWLEFLLTKAGYDGLEEVLGYYADIGWISEEVMFRMIKYARGIKTPQMPEREDGLMTTQDHIISLLFIEALRNGGFREEDLFAVERQVQKIKKEASQIYGV
jgi:flagellar protein FlaD